MLDEPVATAILLAEQETGALALAGDVCVVSRLARQFAGHGVTEVVVIARPGAAQRLRSTGLAVRVSPDDAEDLAAVAELTLTAPGLVIVAAANLVASDSVISTALASGAVVAFTASRGTPVRVERGRVISAGSTWHQVSEPTAHFAGLLRVGATSRDAVAAALTAAADLVRADTVRADAVQAGSAAAAAPAGSATIDVPNSLNLALVAIVRAGVAVVARGAAGLVCGAVPDAVEAESALTELGGVNEDAVRLRSSVKSDDDLFATYAVSTWSPLLVRLAARWRLSPTAVTGLAVLTCLFAAAAFAQSSRPAAIIGAILLYFGFVLDCVDGQLARYTQRFSRFGGWLDAMADRGKEFVVYAGLAIGAARSGLGDVWPLAIAAMTLLTVRHMTDGWYGVARDEGVGRLARAPFDLAADPGGSAVTGPPRNRTAGAMESLVRVTNSPRRSFLHWIKKLIVLPIGERWMLIAFGAAVANARVVFVALLIWGAVAAIYTLGVRMWRTWSSPAVTVGRYDIAMHRDDGLVARLLGAVGRGGVAPLPAAAVAAVCGPAFIVAQTDMLEPTGRAIVSVATAFLLVQTALAGRNPHTGSLDWLIPGALRAAELTVLIGAGYGLGVPQPLIFALLGVVALFHYDLAARLEKSGSPFRWRALGLGWDGRLLLLGLGAMVSHALRVPEVAAWSGLTGYLVVVFLMGTLTGAAQPVSAPPPPMPTTRPPLPRQTQPADEAAARVAVE